MSRNITRRAALLGAMSLPLSAQFARGETKMLEDFTGDARARWEFISDQVMGGVSTGRVRLEEAGGSPVLRLTGRVSTANNGGFIQARLKLVERIAASATGLELRLRGNGQAYYIHARTSGTVLPWNFYQARFDAPEAWSTVRVPFSAFTAQGRMLRKALKPEAVKSIAIVAYGRDHEADISVASIGVY